MGTMAPVSGEGGGARSLLEVLLSYQGMGQRRMVAASWQNVFIQGEASVGTNAKQTEVPVPRSALQRPKV